MYNAKNTLQPPSTSPEEDHDNSTRPDDLNTQEMGDVPANSDRTEDLPSRKPASTCLDVEQTDSAPTESQDNHSKDSSCLNRVSVWLTETLENMFERHGRLVASHPSTTAAICMMVSAVCALGSLNFTTELRPYRLWIPQNSEFIEVMNWQSENFPNAYRRHLAVFEADNVLMAKAVQEMWRLHTRVSELTVGPNHTSWDTLCARVPSLPMDEVDPQEADYSDFEYGILQFRRRRDLSQTLSEDQSLKLPRDEYCNSLVSLPQMCLETSLLEVWGLHEDVIMNLTDEQVVEDINSAGISEVFGYRVNFTKYLGSITHDEVGKIIGAKAAMHMWVSLVDQHALDVVVDQGSGELVDTAGFAWEKAWVNTVLNDSSRPGNIRVYAQAASSFGTVSDDNIWGDVKWLVVGMVMMSFFVNVTLGRRNLVQQRPMLAFLGMFSVGQAVAVSYGVCSFFGVPYCPVNSILPILLIGLGVDDMFVIMAAWEATGRDKAISKDRIERAGRTMRHAGVAITVTSLTDVTAFAVGATTDLPALRSFCLFATVGIFAVYLLQATFFLACLVRDEKRMEENKNGFLWCITHKNWKPWSCSERDLLSDAFKYGFCPFILSTPVQVIILVGSGCLLASSVWATTNLRQEFNPMWFIPSTSYLDETVQVLSKHFPEAGESGYIYFSNVTLPEDLPHLNHLIDDLTESQVISSVNAWFTALDEYMSYIPELTNTTLTYPQLQDTLSVFLQSSTGASYRNDFTLDGVLDCNHPAPPITSFRIEITHRPADSRAEQAVALETIKSLLSKTPVSGYKAAWAQAYSIWETNEIIGYELWRNILLAGIVVGVVTLFLLASLLASMLVLGCVVATVIGVSGIIWAWGLTIDTVSCIAIVLSIGLSVDYAAHVAHAFLAKRGVSDKRVRVRAALEGVGPAVLQGGVSTLLSFALLAGSSSHVFMTFFKVFVAASVLGLYYGLVFLPVVLSLVGPDAYDDHSTSTTSCQPATSNCVEASQHRHVYTNSAYLSDEDKNTKNNATV
ncbi:patched domain-containing protein 3-like [Homarus americanus]|nr:patched domain-containing protein 3-like [Homarus americanus]XP_042204825.1 patched domain-containing protein 3-like [Homarus americanus]XP_042204826.1 patched domain-containing protein 3-like [Homarus americanus]